MSRILPRILRCPFMLHGMLLIGSGFSVYLLARLYQPRGAKEPLGRCGRGRAGLRGV